MIRSGAKIDLLWKSNGDKLHLHFTFSGNYAAFFQQRKNISNIYALSIKDNIFIKFLFYILISYILFIFFYYFFCLLHCWFFFSSDSVRTCIVLPVFLQIFSSLYSQLNSVGTHIQEVNSYLQKNGKNDARIVNSCKRLVFQG